jgi:hypothetical protein
MFMLPSTNNLSRPINRRNMSRTATRRVEPQWHHQALIHRPNALVMTSLRAHLRVSPGGTCCVPQLTRAKTSVPRPVPSTKGTTEGSTMVPMTVPMTTLTMTHGTASHTDASHLTTKADTSRTTRPFLTAINHRARTDPVSTCLLGVSAFRSETHSRMSTPFRMSSDFSLTK